MSMDTLGDLTQILANLIIILGVLTWYMWSSQIIIENWGILKHHFSMSFINYVEKKLIINTR